MQLQPYMCALCVPFEFRFVLRPRTALHTTCDLAGQSQASSWFNASAISHIISYSEIAFQIECTNDGSPEVPGTLSSEAPSMLYAVFKP